MMHSNRKLFELATKNAQRNAASQFIERLPADFRKHLEGLEPLYHPEVSALTGPIISKAAGLHRQLEPPLVGAWTKETSSRLAAWQIFNEWASLLPNGEYLLVIAGGNGITFDNATSWVSHLPGYSVSLPAALEWICRLSEQEVKEVLLASRDGEHAAIIETVGGFLPEEPSELEVIYELSSWGLRG
jgi:hypothetical protein